MKVLPSTFPITALLFGATLTGRPATSHGQWTSAYPQIDLVGEFDDEGSPDTHMVLVDHGVWQAFRTVSTRSSIAFTFATADDSHRWGDDDQRRTSPPVAGVAESPGAPIVISNALNRTFRFTLNEVSNEYHVDDVSLQPHPWINEVDYDGIGIDSNEWIEIGGPAGVSLDDYELALINQEGNTYEIHNLAQASFTLSDEADGVGFFVLGIVPNPLGTADFTPAGWIQDEIQNGPMDAIQLRLKTGAESIHLVDFEGDNPHTLQHQVVSIADSNTERRSLYLTGGPGAGFNAFTWVNTLEQETPGSANAGQTFGTITVLPADVEITDVSTAPPLPDIDTPMYIEATLTPVQSPFNLVATAFYRINGSGAFLPLPMTRQAGDRWRTATPIPGQPIGAVVDYYLFVNFEGPGQSSPAIAPPNAPADTFNYAIPRIAAGSFWMNEMNYRPNFFRSPTNEYLELVGPAGSDVGGWQIQLFDTDVHLATYPVPAATQLPDDAAGYGFLVLGDPGVPDVDIELTNSVSVERSFSEEGAIRLVNEQGIVEYEFTYSDPQTLQYPDADYIGNDDNSGFDDPSLGLTGSGGTYAAFTWAVNDTLTPGAPNQNQIFTGGSTNFLPPVILCPGDLSVQSVADVPLPDPGAVTASSSCGDGSVTVTWVGDVENDGAGCLGDPRVVTRTYRAVSDCATTAECSQVITIEDTTPPILICGTTQLTNPDFEDGDFNGWSRNPAGELLASVLSDAAASGFFHAALQTTNQTTTPSLYQDLPASPGQTWKAAIDVLMPSSDPLVGRSRATTDLHFLNVDDVVLAVIRTASVTSNTRPDVYTRHELEGLAPAGTTTARLIASVTGDRDGGGSVYFDNALLSGLNFTIDDHPDCGVPAPDATEWVTVIDHDPGVEIRQIPPVGSTVPMDDPTILLVATDCGGLSATCSVQIAITDNSPPALVGAPNDRTVGCTIPDPPTVIGSDACEDEVSVDFAETIDPAPTNAPPDVESIITRIWSASDSLGNEAIHTQLITVVTCTTNSAPDVIILDVELTDTHLEIVSTGTNTWSLKVDYSTNLLTGEIGWSPMDVLDNNYQDGVHTTLLGLPMTHAPALHYRVRQTDP